MGCEPDRAPIPMQQSDNWGQQTNTSNSMTDMCSSVRPFRVYVVMVTRVEVKMTRGVALTTRDLLRVICRFKGRQGSTREEKVLPSS